MVKQTTTSKWRTLIKTTLTALALGLAVLASTALVAPSAFARQGADDPVGHIRGGHGADDPAGDDRSGGKGRGGNDDGPNHA